MPRPYLHTARPSDFLLTTPLNGFRDRRMVLERMARELYLRQLNYYQYNLNTVLEYTPKYTKRYEECACMEERDIQAMKSRVQLMIHLRVSMSEVREYIARQRQKMITERNEYLDIVTYNMTRMKFISGQFYALMLSCRVKMEECIRNNPLPLPERPSIAYRQGD